MTARGVAFTRRDPQEFVEELKTRVNDFFASRGISPHANTSMVVKTVVLLTALVVPYALILTGDYPPLAMLGLSVMMGVVVAGIGFAVAHDALHGAYSKHKTVNSLLGLTFDMLGANGYLWRIMHNVVHHTYTNVHGADQDLEAAWFLRLSPRAPHRWIHRFQHWYALAPYSLAMLNWVFLKDYKFFFKREIGPYRSKRHPVGQWLLLFGGKFFYYTWAIILPLLLLDLPWWQFAIGFLALHLTTGIILSLVFQLAHVVEETEHPAPMADGTMEHTWMVHELITTANFSMRNPVLGWYVGGLNFQIEHHLFPRVCSVHYPAISRIVRETCEKYGIPYKAHPTLFSALHSHFATLRRLGRGETAEAFAAA